MRAIHKTASKRHEHPLPSGQDRWRLKLAPATLPPSQRQRVFNCSMSGICHRSVPDRFLAEIWETLLAYPHVSEWPGPWPEHIWLGTTSGDPRTKYRLDHLRRSRAQVRFVCRQSRCLAPCCPST
jgi:protein gp37